MAEMVSSAVVQETVSQVLSGLVSRYEEKEESNTNENLERLEMAHIKLEAALEISDKWQIHDASLLRWRRKLKRAAQECDVTLHKCKHRILEEEQMEHEVRNSSFPKRIAHATKSFIFSAFSRNNYELSRSIVRRFEWFADGASEFMRFMELGGTPHCIMPFDSLIKHLFTFKKLQHKVDWENERPLFLVWVPFSTARHGIEASLFFIQKDGKAPEDNFYFSVMLQLSQSTDLVGIAIKCIQLFTHLFKSTVEIIRDKPMRLPTQEFPWVPHVDSRQKEHWDNLHSFGTQWFRPNPLCCKWLDQRELRCGSNIGTSRLSDVCLEPVIEVNLQCQVSPSRGTISRQDSRKLIAGLLFMPHGSSCDRLPANKSSAISVLDGEEQHCLHTDITLEQLEDIMLPKAVDHFHLNAEATVYQMLWKSKHGTAYIQVERASTKMQSTRRMIWGAKEGKILQQRDQVLESRPYVIPHFLNLWVAHAPVQLRGSIVDWIQKEEENWLAPPPLRLKF